MRKSGFYWVRKGKYWEVWQYFALTTKWESAYHNSQPTTDNIFDEIDEHKLEHTPQEEPTMSKEIDWNKPVKCDLGDVSVTSKEGTGDKRALLYNINQKGDLPYWVNNQGIPLWPIGDSFRVRNKETVEGKTAKFFETLLNDPKFSMKPEAVAKKMKEQGLLREE